MNAVLELDPRPSRHPPLEAKTRVRASVLGAAAHIWASTDSTPAPCWGNSLSWTGLASADEDGQNRRIGKKLNGALVEGFLYRNQLQPVVWLNGNGTVRATFVYGLRPNVPEYMVQGATTYRLITDQVGSVRLVLNAATGALVERIDWDEFGNVLSDTAPGAQPFGFAGGIRDVDTALTRFGARDYDATRGRWTTKDMLKFGGGLTNLYSYVGEDPINLADPTGRYFAWLTPEIVTTGLVGTHFHRNHRYPGTHLVPLA